MKVTLRYSGTLSEPAALARLREDFLDIAAIHAWPVDLLDRELAVPSRSRIGGRGSATLAPPLALAGLKVIVHPQTDPLWLTFDEAGVLTRLGGYSLSAPGSPRLGLLHQAQASIQTSIGGVFLHRTVVGLLDYLKRAYVHDLEVTDDSGFWRNRDEAALRLFMDGR